MTAAGDPPLLVVANRALEAVARAFHRKLKGALDLVELKSWGALGVAGALSQWTGGGSFEPFVMQRVRWAILDGMRKHVRQERRVRLRRDVQALLAAEESADLLPDPLPPPRRRDDDAASDSEAPTTRDALRAAAAGYTLQLAADIEPDDIEDETAQIDHDALRMTVRRAVDTLPPPLDRMVDRHHYFGDSISEIAERFQMPKSTAGDTLLRALRLLQVKLCPPSDGDAPDEPLARVVPLARPGFPGSDRKKQKK